MNIYLSTEHVFPFLSKFTQFVQFMCNRLVFGHFRYGQLKSSKDKAFLKRLKLELSAYEKTKNPEQLINIANYAFLEFSTSKTRHDNTVDSVTRDKI